MAKSIANKSSILRQPSSPDLESENQNLDRELQMHFVGEGEINVRCKVMNCGKLFAGVAFWRKHAEKRHPQWYEKMKASVSSRASSMLAEVEEVEKSLEEGTVSMIVTGAQRQSLYLAMVQDLEGAGRWYYCANMHAVRKFIHVPMPELTSTQFTQGNNEASYNMLKCPQCGELVAGPPEGAIDELTNPVDLEHQSWDMLLSRQFELPEMV